MTAAHWLARAEQTLAIARIALQHADRGSAINRAYYAIFYAGRAALLAAGQEERAMGKTHRGLSSAFAEFVVKPGLVSESMSRLLGSEGHRRIVADYLEGDMLEADALEAIRNADIFIAGVRAMLAERGA